MASLTAHHVRDSLAVTLIPLAVIVTLPLVGTILFVLRPVLLAAVIVTLVGGSLLCACSARVREWVDAQAGVEIGYKGLRLAPSFCFDPSHSWARMNGVVVVGADDVVQAALGPVEEVELPPNGLRVRRGDRLFRLRSADRDIEVRAPVSGTVIGTNDELRHRPRLVNEDPFGAGWVTRLRPDESETERAVLLRGKKARIWFHETVDRLVGTPAGAAAPTPTREGVAAPPLHRRIDPEEWTRLTRTMFAPHDVEA